jgi:hypothetical protein
MSLLLACNDGSGMPSTWPGAIATISIVIAVAIVLVVYLRLK